MSSPGDAFACPAAESSPRQSPAIETVIADLCRELRAGRTICPTDAAKAYASIRGEDELGWRSHLHDVRRAAVKLALSGKLVIYRKGKPVDPEHFRGVYRLGMLTSK